jgi:hypothetical protein
MERLEAELRAQLGRFGPAAGLGPIVEAWPEAVGDAIALTAWPARLARDGTLLVHAKDSVWAFELTQRAEEMRARLGEAAPRALRFVVGPIPEAAVETRPEAAATLPQPGPEAAAWAAELAAEIENEELRERVAKAAAFSLAQAAADRRF